MIARLAGREHLAALDERMHVLAQDVDDLKRLALASAAERAAPHLSQRDRLRMHELRVFSQNGEDGLLLFLLGKLGPGSSKRVAEIGIQDGTECNARNLIESLGWSGFLVEGAPAYAAAARTLYAGTADVRDAFVTRDNVDALVREAGDVDVLSIDIDGVDYWVWQAISSIRPRLVVIEYNAYLPPSEFRVVEYRPTFRRYELHDSGFYYGASLEALRVLGEAKGYVLVGCDSAGVNALFVDREQATRVGLQGLTAREAYYPLTSGRKCRPTPAEAFARIATMPFVTSPVDLPRVDGYSGGTS